VGAPKDRHLMPFPPSPPHTSCPLGSPVLSGQTAAFLGTGVIAMPPKRVYLITLQATSGKEPL